MPRTTVVELKMREQDGVTICEMELMNIDGSGRSEPLVVATVSSRLMELNMEENVEAFWKFCEVLSKGLSPFLGTLKETVTVENTEDENLDVVRNRVLGGWEKRMNNEGD